MGEYCIPGQLSFDAPCQISFIISLYSKYIDVHKLHENKNNLLLNRFNFKGDLYIHITFDKHNKGLKCNHV